MMEGAIGRWQGHLRTMKQFREAKLGKRIEVDGIPFGWLIPYVTEIIHKFKMGADGRAAYERITGHRCHHVALDFAEKVEFMLETNKSGKHKADG